MDRFVLDDDIVVRDGGDGRQLTGAEITALIDRLHRARLQALWREIRQQFPLGAWVRSTRTPRATADQVVGYRYAVAPAEEHRLRVRSPRGVDLLIPVTEAERAKPPEGGK
ncbi:hypothetical protein ACFPZ0_10310 [Streptomonospora nanhaiensis]|uniref:hypothetical protein n=1 Tax=Streptomonospora nanhaiensis TaxID=1323731 RepID=UPI001C9921BA|nr:hypothetical protein [Streptomonospora nanhaiensis]MBX9389811.1 hypothetical protein [Streptomonospora nanhaiensis]